MQDHRLWPIIDITPFHCSEWPRDDESDIQLLQSLNSRAYLVQPSDYDLLITMPMTPTLAAMGLGEIQVVMKKIRVIIEMNRFDAALIPHIRCRMTVSIINRYLIDSAKEHPEYRPLLMAISTETMYKAGFSK